MAKTIALGAKFTNPGSTNLHFFLGKHFKNLSEYGQSLDEFKRVQAKDPYYPKIHIEIGRFVSLGLIARAEAIEYFTKEIEISNDPYAYHMRGLMYGVGGEWEKAEEDFKTETSLVRSWAAYIDLGWALLAQEKLDEAEAAVEKALEIDNNSFWGLSGLGVIALKKGDFSKAIALLGKAVERGNALVEADYWLAYPGNDPRGAKKGALAMRAGAHFNLALSYEKTGRHKEAILQYNEYLRLLDQVAEYDIGPNPPVSRKEVEQRIFQLASKKENE